MKTFKYKIGDIVVSGNFYKVKIIDIIIDSDKYQFYKVKGILNSLKIISPYIDKELLEMNTNLHPISRRKEKLQKLNELNENTL